MPVTRSAKKKMRKDKVRTRLNKKRKDLVKDLIKNARKNVTAEDVQKAQSAVDKLAKVKIIHKNKAARLKSQLSKLLGKLNKPKTRSKK